MGILRNSAALGTWRLDPPRDVGTIRRVMAQDDSEQQLDEDGLVVQQYMSQVLLVLPPEGFGDQILRYARSCLYNVHVGSVSVAVDPETEVKGRLQDEFLVDQGLAGQDMSDYSGILIAGNDGESPLANESALLDLVRAADKDGKLIAAWGSAVAVLARAGVLKGRKVTGSPNVRDEVIQAKGKYSGRQTEVCGHIVTALDEGAGMRFGQALAEYVRI